MEGGIYWVYWGFWSGKTLLSVVLILDKLRKWEIVFSNIKLNKLLIPNHNNYYFFDDFDDFVDILKFTWFFAFQVSIENEKRFIKGEPLIWRNQRPKFNIFFDELGIFANSMDFKNIHKDHWDELYQFLLQCRKMFDSIYCIVQKPNLLYSGLRIHIPYWFTYKPLFGIKWLWQYFWEIYLQDLNPETFKVEVRTVSKMDPDWNIYNVDYLEEFSYKYVFFRKRYFKYYDDLFLNKKVEIQFKTDYLDRSNFLYNLKAWLINNKALLNTKPLYAQLTEHIILTPSTYTSYYELIKALLLDCSDFLTVSIPRLFPNFIRYYKKIIFLISILWQKLKIIWQKKVF